MSLKMTQTGDWAKAKSTLTYMAKNTFQQFSTRTALSSKLVLERVIGHIETQDLSWTPLAESTVIGKGGSTLIYIDTGFLKNNLESREAEKRPAFIAFFIGPKTGSRHPSGVTVDRVMTMMEYGTTRMPPRPVIRPSVEEVRHEVIQNAYTTLKNLCFGRKD